MRWSKSEEADFNARIAARVKAQREATIDQAVRMGFEQMYSDPERARERMRTFAEGNAKAGPTSAFRATAAAINYFNALRLTEPLARWTRIPL